MSEQLCAKCKHRVSVSQFYKTSVPPKEPTFSSCCKQCLPESQVLESIEKAVRVLCPSFVFGHYILGDIQQEARIMGLECLTKYDPEKPLDNFVYTHIRNRLSNLKRNKLRRNDPPCQKCHNNELCTDNGAYCKKYREWHERNSTKANLAKPLDLNHISDDNERRTRLESEVETDVEVDELVKLVDERLPVELRQPFLQMKAGVSIPKSKRQQVEKAVRDILSDVGVDNYE